MEQTLTPSRRTGLKADFSLPDMLPALLELWRRRELLFHMTVRHLKGQYKQSILGYAWTFVNPLSQMFILTFVFSTLIRVQTPGIPYALFLFMGLLPWNFFSASLTSATLPVGEGREAEKKFQGRSPMNRKRG